VLIAKKEAPRFSGGASLLPHAGHNCSHPGGTLFVTIKRHPVLTYFLGFKRDYTDSGRVRPEIPNPKEMYDYRCIYKSSVFNFGLQR
jgi:hypothetical protein